MTSEKKPTRAEVEAAVKTIIRWTGDDPSRDGLQETPSRVVRAYEEYFRGYNEDPESILQKTFEEIEGYDEMIVLRGIRFESHCEHHMAPIIGRAWVAYIPNGRVVGLSKLPRLVDIFARRLQVQERLTRQIAECVQEILDPAGVGVVIEASHLCMMMRGVEKQQSTTRTSTLLGRLRDDDRARAEFLALTGGR